MGYIILTSAVIVVASWLVPWEATPEWGRVVVSAASAVVLYAAVGLAATLLTH